MVLQVGVVPSSVSQKGLPSATGASSQMILENRAPVCRQLEVLTTEVAARLTDNTEITNIKQLGSLTSGE